MPLTAAGDLSPSTSFAQQARSQIALGTDPTLSPQDNSKLVRPHEEGLKSRNF